MSGCRANGCGEYWYCCERCQAPQDNTSQALDRLAELEKAANQVVLTKTPCTAFGFTAVSSAALGRLERVLAGKDEPSQEPCHATINGTCGTFTIQGENIPPLVVGRWASFDICPTNDCRTPPPDTIEQIAEKRRRQRDDARDERDEARKELKKCRRERDCLRREASELRQEMAECCKRVIVPVASRPTPLELAQADEIKRLRANCNGFFDSAHDLGKQVERLKAENDELAERNTAINEMLAKAEHKAEQAAAEAKGILNNLGMLADAVFAYINNPLLKNLTTLTTFAQDARRKATHQQATPQESHS